MEEHAETKKLWTFDRLIRLKYASDLVTYVKAFDERWLAVVDRKGCGELYDMENNCSASRFSLMKQGGTITGMVLHHDKDGKQMILASIEGDHRVDCCLLYERRGTTPITTPGNPIVCLDDQRRLGLFHPRATVNTRFLLIDITWNAINDHTRKGYPPTLRESEILGVIDQDAPLSDGLVVTEHYLLHHYPERHWKRLTDEMFDVTTLDSDARKSLVGKSHSYPNGIHGECIESPSLQKIFCYHRTINERMYVGYDNGLVSCWK
jgi:hypothetical protein